jgi:histidinol-phosphate aminotransferase
VFQIYPDPTQVYLRRDIAKFIGVTPDYICGGCGSDEILDLLIRLFDPPGIVNLPPTFGMYPFLAKIARAPIVTINRGPIPLFSIDMASIELAVSKGASLIFLASPNNPTGGMLSLEEVRKLCSLNAIVVVDEAYAEFASRELSACNLVTTHPNLVVLRTFSKWAGLAGLRVGYSVASPAITSALLAIKQPYNVNVAADIGARAALTHADKIMKLQVLPMISERDRMILELEKFGWLIPVPTSSNFVLFQLLPPYNASEVVAALRKRGVLVRYYPSGRLSGYIRISAGRPSDTDKLLKCMKEIEAEQQKAHGRGLAHNVSTILFDMDGVLVEVSRSYRAAIIATAAHFGAFVSHADIDKVKAAGGANNDWAVTKTLIKSTIGKDVPIEDVTKEFEALYQGDLAVGDHGLKATESALVDTATLLELKKRMTGGLAVVTGRPRRDAMEAIERYGWTNVFDVVVCMEDAKLKPDPEPVQKALEGLRAKYAAKLHASEGFSMEIAFKIAKERITPASSVIIGDTVDDVRAGTSAGVQALGCFPPDKSPAEAPELASKLLANLTSSGAQFVLEPGCLELLRLTLPKESQEELFAANKERVASWNAPKTGASSTSSHAHAMKGSSAGAVPAPSSASKTIGSGIGRTGSCSRKTKETDIYVWVNLDGHGESSVDTGLGFYDHMLSAFSKHGHFDLVVSCKGDLHIDDHHTVEDVALALGEAVDKALGARVGIARWGFALCPLDEALSRVSIDISSRPFSSVSIPFAREKVGDVSTEMLIHAFESFATTARVTLHVDNLKGSNDHHKAESSFKALGVALRSAVSFDENSGVPSTKGVLA